MGSRKKQQAECQQVSVNSPRFADCVAKAMEWNRGFTSLHRSLIRAGLRLDKPARQELQRIFGEMRSAQWTAILSQYDDAEIQAIEARIREAPSYERRWLRRLVATRQLQQRRGDAANASTDELREVFRDASSYERPLITKLIRRRKIKARRARKRKDARDAIRDR